MDIDVLFTGGTVHTLKDEREAFRYMGVRHGRVCCLADEHPGLAAREVDLAGAHVWPALIDAHLHLMSTLMMAASSFYVCEISGGTVVPGNLAGVAEKVAARCAGKPNNAVVVGNNYITSAVAEHRLPTRFELDEWGGGRPVVIYNIDAHSSTLSTAMLRLVGMDAEGSDGVLTGADHEFNQGRISACIAASISDARLEAGVADFTRQCLSYGIAHVCALDGSGDLDTDPLTEKLADIARRMAIGVRLYPQYMDVAKARPYWGVMSRRRIGGCFEWELDGSVGSHSAAFYLPYKDTGALHGCYYPQDVLDAAVRAADAEGCQIAAHAIGTKAIDSILDAYDGLDTEIMHRVEHFLFPSPQAVERVCRSGRLALSVQPGYDWIDKRYLHSYGQHLPGTVIDLLCPLRTLAGAGVPLMASSDAPVQSIDPFLQMLGMVDFYRPEESLTMYQALCAYTKSPARVLGEDADLGTLEVGKLADFFTTKDDLLTAPPESLPGRRVEGTWLRGARPSSTAAELCQCPPRAI